MGILKNILIEIEEYHSYEDYTLSDGAFGYLLDDLFNNKNEFTQSKKKYGLRDFMSVCQSVLDCRKAKNFDSLKFKDKVNYYKDRNKDIKDIDMELFGLLCSVEKRPTLLDIYNIVSDFFKKYDFDKNELNLNELLKDKDDILFTSVELYSSKLQDFLIDEAGSVTTKKITIWTFDEMLYFILKNDYKEYANIEVKDNDMYYSNNIDKFSTVLCIPEYWHDRGTLMKKAYNSNNLGVYGCEILFNENLNEDGTLYIVLPDNINSSKEEKEFRDEYANHLISVKNLPADTFNYKKRSKTYLYEFSKPERQGPLMLSGFGSDAPNDCIGKKFDEILDKDKWNFELPFMVKQ